MNLEGLGYMGFDPWEASIICEKVADGVSLTNLSLNPLWCAQATNHLKDIPGICSLNQKIKKYLNLYHLDTRWIFKYSKQPFLTEAFSRG
jgi:hypothetical protein